MGFRRWWRRRARAAATTKARATTTAIATAAPARPRTSTDALVGVTQILSRRSLVELSYSYGKSDGYLTDPYKLLSVVDPVTGIPVAGRRTKRRSSTCTRQRPDHAHQAERLRRMAPRLRPRLDGGQPALHDRRLGRDVGDTGDALPLEHQRAQLPRAAPALLHADRSRLLPHGAVRRRSAARSSRRRTIASRTSTPTRSARSTATRPTAASSRCGSSTIGRRARRRPARTSASSRTIELILPTSAAIAAIWVPIPLLSSPARTATGAPASWPWRALAKCSARPMTPGSRGASASPPAPKRSASTASSAATARQRRARDPCEPRQAVSRGRRDRAAARLRRRALAAERGRLRPDLGRAASRLEFRRGPGRRRAWPGSRNCSNASAGSACAGSRRS